MSLQHNGRIMPKRIHVRIEHVRPSRCKEEFLKRSKENDEIKHQAKQRGGKQTPYQDACLFCLHTFAVSLEATHWCKPVKGAISKSATQLADIQSAQSDTEQQLWQLPASIDGTADSQLQIRCLYVSAFAAKTCIDGSAKQLHFRCSK